MLCPLRLKGPHIRFIGIAIGKIIFLAVYLVINQRHFKLVLMQEKR